MKLKKVIIPALCCSLCFGTVFYTTGCSKIRAEKERIAAEKAAEVKRIADEAIAQAKAESEARAEAEKKAAEEAERERLLDELSAISLEEIVQGNNLLFVVDDNIRICKENNRWYCTFEGGNRFPIFLDYEIKGDVLNIYYSNENVDVSYKETENGYDYNYPSYVDYDYFQTKKFSIKRSQLIEYLTTKDYKLPEVVDCDTYDDSIQYFNPVNNISAAVVADYASVKDVPRGVGDIQSVAELNQWDVVRLFGRTTLSASLDGTKEKPFYLINVKNEKGKIVPGWIHGSLIKIFRTNSDLEKLKLNFSEIDTPVLVSGVAYSGKKVPVDGNVLSYYGYNEHNPVIDSIESFLNYYSDSELENVKEFYLDFANPESGELNPALGDGGYGEIPSLESIERMAGLEILHIGDSVHLKSLKGMENLKNLKKLVVFYDSLSDEDKLFLEPFKTKKQGTFYFNGYNGEDDELSNVITSKDLYSYGMEKHDKSYYDYFVIDETAYIRDGASTGHMIFTVVNKGEKLHILSKSESTDFVGDKEDYWYNVELRNGITGWIFGASVYNVNNNEAPAES